MIRRDAECSSGGLAQWHLISQVDHAHLAAQLAEHWTEPPFAPLVPRDELLAAIFHHDDGWSSWEMAPDVDPRTGKPRAFTEMPIRETLSIWRDSIVRAAQIGPLAGYVVAGHFCNLLKRFDTWRRENEQGRQLCEAFLRDFAAQMAQWLSNRQSGNDPNCHFEVAHRALSYLQLFDALSLWLCCAERREPATFATPGGPDVRFTPVTPQRIEILPWPARAGDFLLEVRGRAVAAISYRDRAELAAAPSEPVSLRWNIERPQI